MPKKTLTITVFLVGLVLIAGVVASENPTGPARRLKDISTSPTTDTGSFAKGFMGLGGVRLFDAADRRHGDRDAEPFGKQAFQAPRNPLALRRRFDQDPSSRVGPQDRREPISLSADPLFDDLPFRRDDANLALILVYVDRNRGHK